VSLAQPLHIALFLPPGFRTTTDWQEHLRASLPGERVTLAAELTPDERAQVTVALVRGVDPFCGELLPSGGGGASVDLLGLYPNLAFIHCLWAGVEKLLSDADLPPTLPLVRMIDPNMTTMMTASAVAHVLDAHCNHQRYREAQHREEWDTSATIRTPADTQVTVLGFGELGKATSVALRQLGFPVCAVRSSLSSPTGLSDAEVDRLLRVTTDLTAAISQANIIVNLLPLTPGTSGLLDAKFFTSLRPGCVLINLARGSHINDDDLLQALANGQLGRAILDVFTHEPLTAGHPFWQHPQITITPHVAATTDPRSASAVVASNIAAWRLNQPIPGLVDRQKGY
jgi:glyoxylate/hydroxypyruvate reductase